MADLIVELVPGIWRVRFVGDYLNGFMIREDDGRVTLVDVGLAFTAGKVATALRRIGAGPGDVCRIILTHAHSDHAGAAAEISDRTGQGIWAHTDDAASLRTGRSAPFAPGLPRAVMRLLRLDRLAPVDVTREFHDGELLPVGGGLRVIHTPGHSPGHVSLLHEPSALLITGDAIFNISGLRWPASPLCTDFVMTTQTAHRLADDIDYQMAAFTHGPEIRQRPREAIRTFLAAGTGPGRRLRRR